MARKMSLIEKEAQRRNIDLKPKKKPGFFKRGANFLAESTRDAVRGVGVVTQKAREKAQKNRQQRFDAAKKELKELKLLEKIERKKAKIRKLQGRTQKKKDDFQNMIGNFRLI